MTGHAQGREYLKGIQFTLENDGQHLSRYEQLTLNTLYQQLEGNSFITGEQKSKVDRIFIKVSERIANKKHSGSSKKGEKKSNGKRRKK